MADTAQEQLRSLEQRLSQNPQSPLFVRLAALYLQNGRANDALRLCDDGLAHFPFYSTAHLVKGKALVELGMMAEAKHEYDVVDELLPLSETAAKLSASIDLGPSQNLQATPAAEEVVEAEPATEAPIEPSPIQAAEELPAIAEQEPPPQEAAPTEARGFVAEETPSAEFGVQEPVAEVPAEEAQAADASFGFGETQTAEPQPETPGITEQPGFEMPAETQQAAPDFGFGAAEQTPVVEETGFGEQPVQEPQVAAEPEQPQETFGFESPAAETAPAVSEPTPQSEPPAADWSEAFSQLQQPAEETPATPAAAPQGEEENPFAMFGTEEPAVSAEGEPYEEFTSRVRMELFGTEDTMTLEEYLNQTAPPPSQAPAEDNIGELAEKLKASPRITPPVINFSEKAARPAGEADPAGGTGFVTPTLAEIYVKQGWFDDAIKAYRALATNKPAESEKFQQRIAEIEEMKKKQ